jgi:hypothetical protein
MAHGGHGGGTGGAGGARAVSVPGYGPDALGAALEEEKKAAQQAYLRDLATSGALYMIGRGERAPKPEMKVPSAVQSFLAKRGLAQDEATAKAAAAPPPAEWGAPAGVTRSEAVAGGWIKRPEHKPADIELGPPPPEWGAPTSVATRKEARAFGYGPKVPEPADPMKAPPNAALRAELIKNGKDPEMFPTQAAGLAALGPRFMLPEQIIEGPGGQLFRVPTKGPDLTPKPIGGPGGGDKFIKDKDLSPAAGRDLSEVASDVLAFEEIGRSFKDDYAGMGLTSGLQVGAAKSLGSMGTSGQQEMAEFWKSFDRLINLPQRNKMFGASLTPGEKSSWEQAQNLSAKSDPKIVRRIRNAHRDHAPEGEGAGRRPDRGWLRRRRSRQRDVRDLREGARRHGRGGRSGAGCG